MGRARDCSSLLGRPVEHTPECWTAVAASTDCCSSSSTVHPVEVAEVGCTGAEQAVHYTRMTGLDTAVAVVVAVQHTARRKDSIQHPVEAEAVD